jgi:hypothetical protein
LFVFIFAGHKIIPETAGWGAAGIGWDRNTTLNHPNLEYRGYEPIFVHNGMVLGLKGENIYEYYLETTPSRHMTFIFNMFVWF